MQCGMPTYMNKYMTWGTAEDRNFEPFSPRFGHFQTVSIFDLEPNWGGHGQSGCYASDTPVL